MLSVVGCRSQQVRPGEKRQLTRDESKPMSWHRNVTIELVRTFFEDRHLGELLGKASSFEHEGTHFVAFQYKQPLSLELRGVDWLDSPGSQVVLGGHGTYWETAAKIMATGSLTESNADNTYGGHEYRLSAPGVYVTPQFKSYGTHYSWPCNAFGNGAFYGICSKGGKSCAYQVSENNGFP